MPANFEALDSALAEEKKLAREKTPVPESLKNIDLDGLIAEISKVEKNWNWEHMVGGLIAKKLGKEATRVQYFELIKYLKDIKIFAVASRNIESGFSEFRLSQNWEPLLPSDDLTIFDMYADSHFK